MKCKSRFPVYSESSKHDAKYPLSKHTVVLGENFEVSNYNTQLKPVSSLKRAGNYYQIRMRSLQFLLLLTADALSSCEHQSSLAIFGARHIFPPFRVLCLRLQFGTGTQIKMASSSDDEEANSSERFDNLCRDLNMDEETSQEAWSSYQKISTNYTLEVPFVCVRLCSLHACFESYV